VKHDLRKKWRDQRGFTLIEIVVTIIISAILAVILAQVMSGESWRGFWPIRATEETLVLKRAMENITSDYAQLLRIDPMPLVTLQERVRSVSYWDDASPIGVSDNYCMTLGEDGGAAPGESSPITNCGPDDTILKLTLSNGSQSLTALFTR
jgi:prepilin-type N-terminal cleavage/methylation domain-containing protein